MCGGLLLVAVVASTRSHGFDNVSNVFAPLRQKSHVERIRSGQATYAIDVGGTVDMDNTMTRLYETFKIAFQNNLSLTIANTGMVTVKQPRVVTNGIRRWWTKEGRRPLANLPAFEHRSVDDFRFDARRLADRRTAV